MSGQLHAPAALPPGKEPTGTHWIESWMDPRTGLDDVERRKILPLPGLEIQPVASPYTACAIPAPKFNIIYTYTHTNDAKQIVLMLLLHCLLSPQ
jgi:hypothetical protein